MTSLLVRIWCPTNCQPVTSSLLPSRPDSSYRLPVGSLHTGLCLEYYLEEFINRCYTKHFIIWYSLMIYVSFTHLYMSTWYCKIANLKREDKKVLKSLLKKKLVILIFPSFLHTYFTKNLSPLVPVQLKTSLWSVYLKVKGQRSEVMQHSCARFLKAAPMTHPNGWNQAVNQSCLMDKVLVINNYYSYP